MSALRVGVVGAGYWGPNLVRNFAATPGIEVACVCDVDAQRLESIGRQFRVGRTTRRFEDLLADRTIEAIALATPVATHRPLGEAALRAGKHLWVEKPLAGSVADGEALVDAARAQERVLFVDHTFIYTPAVRKVREVVASGQLGDVLYFDSVRVNLGVFQSDTNVMWDLGPHDLSIAQYVLSATPRQVSAIGARHVDDNHEDQVYLTLLYDGNLISHFHFNWLAPVKLRLTLIGGSRKMVVYDDLEPVDKVKIFDKGVDVTSDEARRHALISYRTGDMHSPRLEQVEALSCAAKEFLAAITEQRAPLTGGAAGLEVVRILAAAQRSLELGGTLVSP